MNPDNINRKVVFAELLLAIYKASPFSAMYFQDGRLIEVADGVAVLEFPADVLQMVDCRKNRELIVDRLADLGLDVQFVEFREEERE